MAFPTTDEITSRGPRPRRRHSSRSASRRRERRQEQDEPESGAESASGAEDDVDSGSEDEDGLPAPIRPPPILVPAPILPDAPSPLLPPPSPVLPPLPPPSPPTTSLNAITTFRVDKGGVIASALPDDNANPQPPLNVIIPGAEFAIPVPTFESELIPGAEVAIPVPTFEPEPVLFTTLETRTAADTATITVTQSTATGSTMTYSGSASSAWPTDVDKEFIRTGDGYDDDDNSGSGDTARHIMIGGGSIGAFIAVCLVSWLAWRMTKARKRNGGRDGSPWRRYLPGSRRPSVARQARVAGALGKIPWVRDQPWAQRWQTLGDEDALFPAPAEKSSAGGGRDRPHSESGAPDDDAGGGEKGVAEVARAVSLQRVVVPQIDTTTPPQQAASPLEAAVLGAAVVASHQQRQPSLGPPGSQDGGTWVYVSPTQSRPGDHPWAAEQRREANRESSLTSLSSGFGDGDMVFPERAVAGEGVAGLTVPQPPAPSASRAGSSVMGGSNRDTVYTATSDDQPTSRFRTVSSWVNQQKGRVHRAQERLRDGSAVPGGGGGDDGGDVPPVPGIPAGTGAGGMPPEPQLSMMMPDGEVPRRVDAEGLMGAGR